MSRFTDRLADTLRGERIVSLAIWDVYTDLADAGLSAVIPRELLAAPPFPAHR
jgi:hypothetical protein